MELLKVKHATVRVEGRNLWEDLNFSVNSGDFIAVLGPNGVGKTTFLRSILKEIKLAHGEIIRAENLRLGYLPQYDEISTTMPMRSFDLVKLNLLHKYKEKNDKKTIENLLGSVVPKELIYRQYDDLSGGQKKRVRIAQLLVRNPQLILCDEPLANLDVTSKKGIIQTISDQAKKINAGVIFTTHEINVVLPYCNKVLYLSPHDYRIGTPDEILNSKTLSELYKPPVKVVDIEGKKVIISELDF